MRKNILLALLSLFSAASFFACNPSDNKLTTTKSVSDMTATVNSYGWSATSANGVRGKSVANVPTLTITGTQLVGNYLESINIKINNYQPYNFFNIADTAGSTASYSTNGLTYNAVSGQVHVTTDSSGLIRGVFNFNAGTYNITQGAFQCTAY